MTLDGIIKKYGTHELDIDFCRNEKGITTVYAYCHQHNVNGQFMVNHYLKIAGKFTVLKADVDDESDIDIHIASIEKCTDGTYEISGVGGYVKFSIEDKLIVEELTENDYNEQLR